MRPKRVARGRLAHSIDVADNGAEPISWATARMLGRGRPKNLVLERLLGGLNTVMSSSEDGAGKLQLPEISWRPSSKSELLLENL